MGDHTNLEISGTNNHFKKKKKMALEFESKLKQKRETILLTKRKQNRCRI